MSHFAIDMSFLRVCGAFLKLLEPLVEPTEIPLGCLGARPGREDNLSLCASPIKA
jgi:hypothetical protein